MPLGDVPGAILGGVCRFVVDFVFEVLVKGTGHLVATRVLRLRSTDPDGVLVIVLGLMVWCMLAAAVAIGLGRAGPAALS